MDKINGKDIIREIDMYGYPIDVTKTYVVDHINGFGEPEYVTAEAWGNSHREVTIRIEDFDPEFRGFFE